MKKLFLLFLLAMSFNVFIGQEEIPTLRFEYPYGYDAITIEVYKDGVLDTTVVTSDSVHAIGEYSYGHDFRIVLRKKRYITKIIDVFAKDYSRVSDKITIVNFSGKLEPRKNFKSKKTFRQPVAIIRIDEEGQLNFDFEFVEKRKEEINQYRRKRQRQ